MTDELTSHFLDQGFSLIETHISHVFLRGDEVLKLKRPVELGFLDFGTPDKRRRACEAEVALNRRLAPAVYRGVLAIVRSADGIQTVPVAQLSGQPILDWAVHMDRLADTDRLDVCLASGGLDGQELDALAGLLVEFHAQCRADQETKQFGSPAVITKNVEENFQQVRALVVDHLSSDELASIQSFQRAFLRDHHHLFEARMEGGFVRDGHGDLRLEHVYRSADKKHVVIDCIEFNERFRYADVCADLAFLSMDLRSLGHPERAELLLAAYAKRSDDYQLFQLVDFYESYRAFVRGKVLTMLAHDPDASESARRAAWARARHFFLLSLANLDRPLQPARLLICMGSIASGKSTLAESLAAQLGAAVLSADWTRKRMLGEQPETALHEPAFAGAYSESTSQRVYERLRTRAELLLRTGRTVILDATFRSREERASVLSLARRCSVPLIFLECRCPRDVALARLAQRALTGGVSDGRAEIYDTFLSRFEPASELPPEAHLVLDTSARSEEVVAQVLASLP